MCVLTLPMLEGRIVHVLSLVAAGCHDTYAASYKPQVRYRILLSLLRGVHAYDNRLHSYDGLYINLSRKRVININESQHT